MGERICITGFPGSGKTTLALKLAEGSWSPKLIHTDDLLEREDKGEEIVRLLGEPGPWIMEGCEVTRGLRRALAGGNSRPCDQVIWLTTQYRDITPGAASFGKGTATILAKISIQLADAGVSIVYE